MGLSGSRYLVFQPIVILYSMASLDVLIYKYVLVAHEYKGLVSDWTSDSEVLRWRCRTKRAALGWTAFSLAIPMLQSPNWNRILQDCKISQKNDAATPTGREKSTSSTVLVAGALMTRERNIQRKTECFLTLIVWHVQAHIVAFHRCTDLLSNRRSMSQ